MKTINHAVKNLPKGIAHQIKRAFEATGCLDIYGGNLQQYLMIIAQVLEIKNKQLAVLVSEITEKKFKEIIQIIKYKNY